MTDVRSTKNNDVAIIGQSHYGVAMITPAQSRAARALLNWSQPQLAGLSGTSVSTIRDFETGKRTPIANNLAAIQRALEDGGVEFTNGDRPGRGMKAAKGRKR